MSQDALFIAAIAYVFVFIASIAVFSSFYFKHLARKQTEANEK